MCDWEAQNASRRRRVNASHPASFPFGYVFLFFLLATTKRSAMQNVDLGSANERGNKKKIVLLV